LLDKWLEMPMRSNAIGHDVDAAEFSNDILYPSSHSIEAARIDLIESDSTTHRSRRSLHFHRTRSIPAKTQYDIRSTFGEHLRNRTTYATTRAGYQCNPTGKIK
jgi:hypothetical protein